ncbi:MAG TPA: gephyrin-like molybdotransferase Glp [Terriglobales bacterium]|nr:gephyrin-like molybdotransferase Glp [Terriglobales bacterium]
MPATESLTILSFEDARHVVEEHASHLRPHGKELLDLLDGAGQVLAEPVNADRNFPPFPRATRDGYAVRAADVAQAPAELEVVGELKAGGSLEPKFQLQAGQAVSIMTGAPAPNGADAVVMVEYTSLQGPRVTVNRSAARGENIVSTGAEAKRGARLLTPGQRLDHAAIAIAASVGRSRLLVYSKPQVAVLSTGDEVVDIDVPPGPHQIRNSNSYSLAAQIRAAGGEPLILPIAPDEPERLRELIADGLEADLLLLTGGVSMGKYDLVEEVLGDFKAEFFFTGAQIQPGKPVVFGRVAGGDDGGAKYFFGLPGNPVSTMVTFELFARPVIDALAGAAPQKLVFSRAQLKSEIKTRTGLKRFLPAMLSGEFEQAEVELMPWHGSGDIAATARANCYLVVPPDREKLAAGEWVAVLKK